MNDHSSKDKKTIIIGGGPAGLTAALELSKLGVPATVLEADKQVGGIARTVNYKGYLFDIGGHRFFTKWDEVNEIWNEVLGGKFLERPRLSRIYYKKKFFMYPLVAKNALSCSREHAKLTNVATYWKPSGFLRRCSELR